MNMIILKYKMGNQIKMLMIQNIVYNIRAIMKYNHMITDSHYLLMH
jgi:hypothetical protein